MAKKSRSGENTSAAPATSSGKIAKKVPKTAAPSTEPGKKKRKTHKYVSFKRFIHAVLKQVHPECKINTKSAAIMDNFMHDMFEKIAKEAAGLLHHNRKKIMTSREIQTAVRLMLPGELARHAVSEGTKAVTKYTS